jgi:KUP system potassium uptake protein
VVPITLLVLTVLFAAQRFGTGMVGRFFGPITLVWFGVLAVLGVWHIADNPAVLMALSPHYAVGFLLGEPAVAFVALGSVVLCVTGAEALYADLGHFGKKPIRLAWFAVVMPALLLNYFGQGAMLLADPEKVHNPFYEMAPEWALFPLIGLATLATVIASQALITAAFSVTKQAIQLGYLPRLQIQHTSIHETGQIYVPFINWSLFACIVLAVGAFGSSSALASAYGIAVTIDMTITTVMTYFVIRYGWKLNPLLCVAATGFFFIVDLVFFSANVVKIFDGGWFPLLLGALMFTLMTTWQTGRALMGERLREDAIPLPDFLEAIFVSPPVRVPGTAVFLSAEKGVVPTALMHNLKHNKVLHEQNLFVTVRHHEVPWIAPAERVELEDLGHQCWAVVLNFGFKDEPDVPKGLRLVAHHGIELEDMETSYFLSRDSVIPTIADGMALWREKLFASMHHNAEGAADFLNLPTNRIVELGSKVEI